MTIPALIDKQDTVEIVRDQVAAILKAESVSQVGLAAAAGKPDPSLWDLRVFIERASIWENLPAFSANTPVVNVWWDSSSFDKSKSNVVERQASTATIHVDCYGYGQSESDGAGHAAGDKLAAEAAQRAVRLARNILMAAEYTYLGLQGTVWGRWIPSVTLLQPQQDNVQANHVVAGRISLAVEFNEFSPQVESQELELLTIDVQRTEDSEVILEADYDYSTEDF